MYKSDDNERNAVSIPVRGLLSVDLIGLVVTFVDWLVRD